MSTIDLDFGADGHRHVFSIYSFTSLYPDGTLGFVYLCEHRDCPEQESFPRFRLRRAIRAERLLAERRAVSPSTALEVVSPGGDQ